MEDSQMYSGKGTIPISARIYHQYMDYMRMNCINVNKAINNALYLLIVAHQRDEDFRQYYDRFQNVIDYKIARR